MNKTIINDLDVSELREFVASLGEPAFRAKQLFEWIYSRRAQSFQAMTSLSKTFRTKLEEVATFEEAKFLEAQTSRTDGTTKLLFGLIDGKRIESVLIPWQTGFEDQRSMRSTESPSADRRGGRAGLTLCLSTQVGCPLDCVFCATGVMGFARNLSAAEIIQQIVQAERVATRPITNVVYMGMGEPLMNYDNVMKSVRIISTAMGIAARRITISTAGWADHIRRMADDGCKAKLAVSLHSTDSDVRSKLMPVTKKYPLPSLISAVEYYYSLIKCRVTFEYILFDGLNDTNDDLRRVVKLARQIPCKINIVPFHSIAFMGPEGFASKLRPTPQDRAEEFVRRLREEHITVFVRSSAGEDIDAACGQLAVLHDQPAQCGVSKVLLHSFQCKV